MKISELKQQFHTIFQTMETPKIFFAPGRVNLIGEHTDYNGGYALPVAISFGTYALVRKRNDNQLRFYSINFAKDGIKESTLQSTAFNHQATWENYPLGMIYHFQQKGYEISHGLDILFFGNIPNGAGLSSSASIEMVTGILLHKLFHLNINPVDIVKLGQKVENDYIGVQSGLMDQFAVMMGKQDHAIFLNSETLQYEYAPVELNDYSIIIINTNYRRNLTDSKYNERYKQCQDALQSLQTVLNVHHLAQITPEKFLQHKAVINDPLLAKRAKHVIEENERTKKAFQYLKNNELLKFGQLMNESHISLQKDYEVTGLALDTIVQTAWKQPGVIGARMTGAGFGGCAIAIVHQDYIIPFKTNVNEQYKNTFRYDATFYDTMISDGAKEIFL